MNGNSQKALNHTKGFGLVFKVWFNFGLNLKLCLEVVFDERH